MPRAQGYAGAAMYRMYGMPRAQGCTGVAMYRTVYESTEAVVYIDE